MDSRTCYRHTSRPTGTSCTRCDRPICPDCMIQAPVGHHCPTCVQEGRTQMRQVKRVRFTDRMAVGAGAVTLTLVAVNVLVYLMDASRPEFFLRYADNAVLVAVQDEYYRMITSAFLHANLFHLAFNMFALVSFGSQVEATIGSVRFVPLYFLAAVGGSAASHYVGMPLGFSVGASGAVFGVLGAYFVIARNRGLDTRQVGGLIVLNLILGSLIPQIDNAAHVGGLLTGGAVAAVYEWASDRWPNARLTAEVVGVLAVAAVIVVLTLVKVAELRNQFPTGGPLGVPVG